MNPAVALIAEFERRGIVLSVEAGRILARPKGVTPATLAEQVRAHKAELIALLSPLAAEEDCRCSRCTAELDPEEYRLSHLCPRCTADAAVALLNRLRCYSLPAGRIPVVRELAERLKAVKNADAETILRALEAFERELVTVGGAPDAELVQAVARVEAAFPGARLIEVRRRPLN